jgi:hypothetical protein
MKGHYIYLRILYLTHPHPHALSTSFIKTLTDLYFGDNEIGDEEIQRKKRALNMNKKLSIHWQ